MSRADLLPLSPAAPAAVPVVSQWPRHEPDEIDAAVSVLESGRVNALLHGEQTTRLARAFAAFCGMEHGFCVANGTLALEVAMRALGIGPGDEIIVPARSFFASAGAVLAVGAKPAFADVCPDSQNIDPQSVARLVGPATKAILAVHLAGWPCDMKALRGIADSNGLFLIEDCAQAHGAAIGSHKVGSFGDAAAFSFCTDKIMSTAGEGGLVLFRTAGHCEAGFSYKDHGKNFARMADGQGRPGEFRFIHDFAGSNFRLTEFQAAIGNCQLAKLPQWLAARRHNARVLMMRLAGDDRIRLPLPGPDITHAWYKFYLQLPGAEDLPGYRSQVIGRLQAAGIPAGSGSCPDMSREGAFANMDIRRDGDLPQARRLGRRTVMLPVDHTLGDEAMHRMADALLKALEV